MSPTKNHHWLFKTEPRTFSWEDLKSAPNKRTHWEGVRNYQARNFIRSMAVGDGVLFYHSVVQPLAIFGLCVVVREAYPDPFQFDPHSKYYDPGSSPGNPRWWVVDVEYRSDFNPPVTREELAQVPGLASMELLRKGSRLSIQPVTREEWNLVVGLRPGTSL